MAGTNNLINSLITFNITAQLPFKLKGSNTYPTWREKIITLLHGYDLMGYIDGSYPCPSYSNSSDFKLWTRQDSLLRNAIMASNDSTIAHIVTFVKTAQ